MSLIGVWAGAKELLGIAPSWDAVAERLRIYSLATVMNAVGRIDALLRNGSTTDLELQLAISIGLFERDRALVIAQRLDVIRARDRASEPLGPRPLYILFGHRSLATILQVAAHVSVLSDEDSDQEQPLTSFGEALLIVNDLVGVTPLNPEGQDVNTEDGRRKWVYYFSAAASEPGSEPTVHQAARAVDLFLSDKPNLHGHEDYVDLPALFTEATGLGVDAFSLALTYFLGTLYSINRENVAQRSASFRPANLMGSTLRFSPDQVKRLFNLGGTDVETFVALMRKAYPVGSLRPFYHLALEQSPLIQFDTFAVCASVHLLERRFTTGLYHTLLNARRGDANKAFRDRLMRYIGHVFADYVLRALQRIATTQAPRIGKKLRRGFANVRLYKETELQAALGRPASRPPTCDGILVMGSAIVLVECKARMFSLAARAGDSPEEFFARLDEIVVEGARQLEATLAALCEGAFASLGLEPWRITHVYPVIVSLQDILLTPILKHYMDERLSKEGYLQQRRIQNIHSHQLEVLDAGDLEWLELAVEQGGAKVTEILRTKQADDFGRGQSLSNWASIRRPWPGIPASARLRFHSALWKQLADSALGYFRAHKQDPAPVSDG